MRDTLFKNTFRYPFKDGCFLSSFLFPLFLPSACRSASMTNSVLDLSRSRRAARFCGSWRKEKRLTRITRRNHGRLEVVTYVNTDTYSVPRDSICQRRCVVLFRGQDSISMYARPCKTQFSTGHPSRHARSIIELESTSLVALFPTLPSALLRSLFSPCPFLFVSFLSFAR